MTILISACIVVGLWLLCGTLSAKMLFNLEPSWKNVHIYTILVISTPIAFPVITIIWVSSKIYEKCF